MQQTIFKVKFWLLILSLIVRLRSWTHYIESPIFKRGTQPVMVAIERVRMVSENQNKKITVELEMTVEKKLMARDVETVGLTRGI